MRNAYFDNVKLLMIFLVVFGHLIEPLTKQNHVINTIYKIIYSFHMPIFIILAGVFSQPDLSKDRITNNLKHLIIPFLVFSLLYEAFNFLLNGSISKYILDFKPYWLLWFLLSLFIWKTILPIIMILKYPLTFSILLSLCMGYSGDSGNFLGISRTIYFLPFFILGHKLGSSRIPDRFPISIPRTYCIAIIFFNILFFNTNGLSHKWLYGIFFDPNISGSEYFYVFTRITLYIVSFLSSAAILALIPSQSYFCSKRGGNSLFVYLWHGFIIKAGVYLGLSQTLTNIPSVIILGVLFLLSALITFILSSNFTKHLTNNFLLIPAQKILLREIKKNPNQK